YCSAFCFHLAFLVRISRIILAATMEINLNNWELYFPRPMYTGAHPVHQATNIGKTVQIMKSLPILMKTREIFVDRRQLLIITIRRMIWSIFGYSWLRSSSPQ